MFSGASRPDRIAGAYPMLFAAGAVVFEQRLRRHGRRWPVAAVATAIVAFGLLLLPISSTVLPPSVTESYMGFMGGLVQIEKGKSASLPQWLVDRTGWKEMVDSVVAVYETLPTEDQEKAILYASNYGSAGALEHFGAAHGLPRVICGHNSYYLWSRGQASTDILIAVGLSQEVLERFFEEVVKAGATRCDYCYDNNVPIFVAKRPIVPLEDVWEKFKHYE